MAIIKYLLKKIEEKPFDKGFDPTGLYYTDPVTWGLAIDDKENDIDEPINEELIERYNPQALQDGLPIATNEGMYVIYPDNPYAFQSREEVEAYFVEVAEIRNQLMNAYKGSEFVEKSAEYHEKVAEIREAQRKHLIAKYGNGTLYRDEESLAEVGELSFMKKEE